MPLSMNQLEQLRPVMENMLEEAKAGNWSELSQLDSKRRDILRYPAEGSSREPANTATPAIASGSRPLSLLPPALAVSAANALAARSRKDQGNTQAPVNARHEALSRELMQLDKDIKSTIEQAKMALLQESREVRAQISARKRYEQTSNMKLPSYG